MARSPREVDGNKIGHFRVSRGICIKTRLSAQPLMRKWLFILSQERLRTWPHFESEDFWNSEVAYLAHTVLMRYMYAFITYSTFVYSSAKRWYISPQKRDNQVRYTSISRKHNVYLPVEGWLLSTLFQSTILKCVFYPPHLHQEHLGRSSSPQWQILW